MKKNNCTLTHGEGKVIHEIFLQFEREFFPDDDDDIESLFSSEIITKMEIDKISSENKNIAEIINSNVLNIQCNLTNTVDLYFTNIGMMCQRSEVSYTECKQIIKIYDTLQKYHFFQNLKFCFNVCEKLNGEIIHDSDIEATRDQVENFLTTIFDKKLI